MGVVLCTRCGQKPKRSPRSKLCTDCFGHCSVCNGPTPLDAEGYPKGTCNACLAAQTKQCSRCGGPHTGTQPYLCQSCSRPYQRNYKRKDLSHERTKQKAYRDANPEKMHERQLKRYGLTPEQYASILAFQGRGCAVCGVTTNPDGRRLYVDHCHATGRVRGILCQHCNQALGLAKDNPATLRKMAYYLENS